MAENVYADFNYNLDFIKSLQAQVSKKIAKLTTKKNSNRKYDFGDSVDNIDIIKLQTYKEILEGMIYCDSCYGDFEVETVVNQIKTLLNKV